jgi:hypothetical protein
MSYDLHLLRRETAGDDPQAALERLDADEPSPDEQERLEALARELKEANPGVDLMRPPREFALQLGYDAECPVVIDICGLDDITLSWSYAPADPGPAFAEVRRYLPVFARHGYVAWDPQLERLYDPDRDEDDARTIHKWGHQGVAAPTAEPERRSWWRRLRGA